jgi:fibronectin-binding autotransporter adhesin
MVPEQATKSTIGSRKAPSSGRRWMAFALAIAIMHGSASLGATYSWTAFAPTSTSGTYNWSSAGSWSSGTAVSGSTTIVTFGTATAGSGTSTVPDNSNTTSNLNYGETFILNQLTWIGSGNAAGTSYLTLTGDTLQFTNNNATLPKLDLSAATAPNATRPLPTINNNIILATGRAASSAAGLQLGVSSNNANLTINGVISGTGGFYKTGAGVVYLTATNTFTGDININRGNSSSGGVVMSGAGQLGATGTYGGNIGVTGSGAFTYNSSATQILTGSIGSSGGAATTGGTVLQMWGPGLLGLAGSSTYNGVTVVTGGTLQLGNANALGSNASGTTNGTSLRASAAGTVLDINGQAIAAEQLTVTGSSNSATVSLVNSNAAATGTWGGVITHATGLFTMGGAGSSVLSGTLSGAGNVSKANAGTVTLAAAQYTGTTGVNAGTLVFGAGSTMSGAGAINVAAGATLGIQSTLAHDITGSGTLSILAGGSLSAASIGTNSLSLVGASGSTAAFSNTAGSSLTGLGSVTLDGNTNLLFPVSNGLTSSGAISISGSSNLLTISGFASSGNTYTLLSGASLSSPGFISLTGSAVGGLTISLGSSGTSGRTTYAFSQTATARQLAVTAAADYWNGGASGVWDTTTANWQLDGAGANTTFVTGDDAVLGTAAAIAVDPAGITAGAITINNASGSVDLSGGALTATNLTRSATGSATIATNVTASQGVSVSGGSLATSGTLTITSGGLGVSGGSFNSSSTVTVSAGGLNVSGGGATLGAASTIAGGVTVTGGTAALNAANTVTGAVAVSGGGTLSLGDAGGAGSAAFSLNNGTLASTLSSGTLANAIALGSGGGTLSGANPLTLTGPITGPGTLTKTGAGEFVVSGSLGNATTGVAVGVAAGSSLRLTGVAKYLSTTATGTVDGTLTLDNTSLVLKGGTVASGTGTIALVGANTITGSTTFSTIAAPISGAGSLVMSANSSTTFVTLSGNNGYSGGTTLNYNVGMGSATAFGTGLITANRTDSNARINNVTGGSLTLANPVTTGTGFVFSITGSPIQLTGTITGSGIIRASGAGTIDLTQQTADTMQNIGSVDMGNGGTVWTSGTGNFGSNASILFSGTGATLLAKGNTGSILQDIKIGASSNVANVNANIDTGVFSISLAGVLSDLNSGTSGGLVKLGSGILTVTGSSTYSRDTTVSAGTLLVDGALYAGSVSGSTTTVAGGAALGGSGIINGNINFASGANFSFDPLTTLTTNGAAVTFGGFGISNVLNLGSSTAEGTYTLMNGSATFDFTNVINVGSGNAVDIGGGKTAYLQQGGGFQLVVVPEPTVFALLAAGGTSLLVAFRRRQRPA